MTTQINTVQINTVFVSADGKVWTEKSITSSDQLIVEISSANYVRWQIPGKADFAYAGMLGKPRDNRQVSPKKYDFAIGSVHLCNDEQLVLRYGVSKNKIHHSSKLHARELRKEIAGCLDRGFNAFALDRHDGLAVLSNDAIEKFTGKVVTKASAPKPANTSEESALPGKNPQRMPLNVRCYDQGLYTWIEIEGQTVDSLVALAGPVRTAFANRFGEAINQSKRRPAMFVKKLIPHSDVYHFFDGLGFTVHVVTDQPVSDAPEAAQPPVGEPVKPVESVPVVQQPGNHASLDAIAALLLQAAQALTALKSA